MCLVRENGKKEAQSLPVITIGVCSHRLKYANILKCPIPRRNRYEVFSRCSLCLENQHVKLARIFSICQFCTRS